MSERQQESNWHPVYSVGDMLDALRACPEFRQMIVWNGHEYAALGVRVEQAIIRLRAMGEGTKYSFEAVGLGDMVNGVVSVTLRDGDDKCRVTMRTIGVPNLEVTRGKRYRVTIEEVPE